MAKSSNTSHTATTAKLPSSGPQAGTGHGGLPHSSGESNFSKGAKGSGMKKGGGRGGYKGSK